MIQALEKDRCRLGDLAIQIEALQRSLSTLKKEQIEAQSRLDAYKYPVLTLPNEVVSEIFVHVLP
ncbi:hypothetical protein C8R45DRAFT_1075458, partial [Mycena sanguinolenta]